MPYSPYYFNNWFIRILFRLVYLRMYKGLDACLMLTNFILLCLPHLSMQKQPKLGRSN